MEKSEFLKLEYSTLRKEIEETKSRIFKLAGIGLIGMPSAYYFAKVEKIDILVLSLPLLICTVVMLFLAESRALMRAGRYIRETIEIAVDGNATGDVGWENWLERHAQHEPGRRLVDKILTYFFYFLFGVYYLASSGLAIEMAKLRYEMVGMGFAIGIYSALGMIFFYYLITNFKFSTKTSY